MDEHLRDQRDFALAQLELLIRRGRQILSAPFDPSTISGSSRARSRDDGARGAPSAGRGAGAAEGIRAWQQDCAAAIHQLSGGSKAHWLSRAFSNALLVRSSERGPQRADCARWGAGGGVVVEADALEIVDRILGVLAQGAASLSRMEDVAGAAGAPPQPRQFEFVHNAELRPVLEQAFADSRAAFERGEFGLSLILSCGVIEALLTDALDHAGAGDHNDSFEVRLTAAERAGLIRGGCARLPAVARTYRDLTDTDGELRADAQVSAREARVAGQVLRVIMRDLNPGR